MVLFRCVLYALRYRYPPQLFGGLIITPLISAAVAICSGMAWWTASKKRAFARSWAIVASVMSIVIFIRPFIFPTQSVWDHHIGALIIGMVGIIAFSWRDKRIDLDVRRD